MNTRLPCKALSAINWAKVKTFIITLYGQYEKTISLHFSWVELKTLNKIKWLYGIECQPIITLKINTHQHQPYSRWAAA